MPDGDRPLRVLAFDFGTQQIGVATGQSLTGAAEPLTVLAARDGRPDWSTLAGLISEWQPAALLVGLPLNMDGTESDFCTRTRRFARRLQGRFGLKVCMVDERLSTAEAKNRRPTPDRNYRRNPVDALAARLICETWLSDPTRCLPP